jgi:hypothetical protein
MAARTALRRALPSLRRGAIHPEHQLRLSRSFSTTLSSPAPNPNPSSSTPEYAIPDPSRPTHFGYETVTEAEKRERVAGVFTSVAESYDRMNDLMSFGWHRVWKYVHLLIPPLPCAQVLPANSLPPAETTSSRPSTPASPPSRPTPTRAGRSTSSTSPAGQATSPSAC